MRRRRKLLFTMWRQTEVPLLLLLLEIASVWSVMMSSNCLSGSPGCLCSWKSGKFVANCSRQNLSQVPNNDYYDYLLGNNQMATLNRDIQQLDLGSNSLTNLEEDEFSVKRFKNLQKIYLNTNQLLQVHSGAFHKLTGLVELDLSENLISELSDVRQLDDDEEEEGEGEEQANNRTSRKKTKVKEKKKKVKLTFLAQLAQLRQLNLASNQLTKLEEFAFSPTKQLRQLYLSRNRISFIDKRAFDGLNVLNILHLDGNKLSHLNGEILAQLPQLHSLQLAGSNPWICDCRLRKLVRQLSGNSASKSALMRERASKQATILEDEPRCLRTGEEETAAANGGKLFGKKSPLSSGVSSVVASLGPEEEVSSQRMDKKESPSSTEEEEDSRWGSSWTNMKLEQLECRPKIVLPDPSSSEQVEISLEMLTDATSNNVINNKNDKHEDKQSKTMATQRHHYLANELIQLTCSFELNDELDLDYSQLEWWLIMNYSSSQQQPAKRRSARLMWRSRWPPSRQATTTPTATAITTTTATIKDGAGARKFATDQAIIMDYVTRARASASTSTRPSSSVQQEAPINQSRPRRLVRVSHLIADAAKIAEAAAGNNRQASSTKQDGDQQQDESKSKVTIEPQTAELMCRITNQAGHTELLHSLLVDSDNPKAQMEAQARQLAQDSWLRRSNNGAGAQLLVSMDTIPQSAWPLDQAKARIAEELLFVEENPPNGEFLQEPLFVPLYLSRELLAAQPTTANGSDSGKESDFDTETDELTARSLSQQQLSDLHQRQATRHTNITIGGSPDLNSTLTLVKPASSATYRQEVQSKALALVRRFTTTRQLGDDPEDGRFVFAGASEPAVATFVSGLNDRSTIGQDGGSRVRLWLRSLYVRYLDKWLQLAIGEAPTLLAICAGLLVGCLLTTFLILRIHCSKQRRVRDSTLDTRTTGQQLKSSLSDSSATDSSAGVNSPIYDDDDHHHHHHHHHHDDDGDAGVIGDKKQPTGSHKSGRTTSELVSIPLPDEFVANKRSSIQAELSTMAMDSGIAVLSSSDFSHSNELQSDEASVRNTGLTRNYSTLDCGSILRYSHETDLDSGHRLIVVSPEQEMQELILSPYFPLGSEHLQHPYGRDLCYHLGQEVAPTTDWQSPIGYQESSPSTIYQNATRAPGLMMKAPSKLRSIEALDCLYQNSNVHTSSSLSRNQHTNDPQRIAAGSNHGYASSSSLVTSPAASTSSTSMTSGNLMAQQHASYACNQSHQLKQSDHDLSHHQEQLPDHVIYLDDALKLLHSSMSDCLQ